MVLVTDLDTPPEIADAVASEVVTVCAAVTGWLSGSQAPRGLRRAAAELGAGAGVYRNAAVAFRSLADADEDQRQVRSRAGVTLLEQGDHHVEVCSGILAKKLWRVRGQPVPPMPQPNDRHPSFIAEADAGPSSTVSSSRPLAAERRRRGRADGSAVRRPLVKSAELRGPHRGADGATAVPGTLDTLRSECSSDGEHGLAEPVEEPPRALRPPTDRLSRLAASESEDRCRELDTD